MEFSRRTLLTQAMAATAAWGVCGSAWADNRWPSKAITYVVPFAPSGATDMIGRLYAQAASKDLGQSMVVDNKPGTGGSLGSAIVARAKPDGYTLVGGTISSHAINSSIYPNVGYDPIKSFEPIILTGKLPNVLVVRSNSGLDSYEALLQKLKSSAVPMTFGSSGVGTSQHLAGELFKDMTHTQLTHVPYKGSGPAMTALMGGEIDMVFENLTAAKPLIEAGRLKALAITSTTASSVLPSVRPLTQLGLPDYEVVSWQATFAPAGTPREIIDRLYKSMSGALQTPEARDRLSALGLEVSGAGPEELRKFQQSEVMRWADVVRKAQIKME